MVAVVVDWPLGEHYVRVFRREHATKRIIVCGIDNRPAVVLPGKHGMRFKNLACLLGFGGAYARASPEVRSAAIPLSTIQVQQHHLVPEFRVTCDRPGAA